MKIGWTGAIQFDPVQSNCNITEIKPIDEFLFQAINATD
jgi:expansin (peptidoglycan-binding protein)